METIEQLIEYTSRWRPTFRDGIQGASAQEVQELKQLVPYPLPRVYEEFLLHLGHGDGGLHVAMDGTADISDILVLYRDFKAGEADIPEQCVVIGTGRLVEDICLMLAPGGEPTVVFTEGDKVIGLYAESLIKLLFRNAFTDFGVSSRPFQAFYTASFADLGRTNKLMQAQQVVCDLGFKEEWFSDGVSICLTRGDTLIAVIQLAGKGMGVLIGASQAGEVDRIVDALRNELGELRRN